MQRTPEEILAKIKELSENEDAWSNEREYGDDSYDSYSTTDCVYDQDKAKAALLAYTEWLTGEKIELHDTATEEASTPEEAFSIPPAFGDYSLGGNPHGFMIGPLCPASIFIWKSSKQQP